MAILYLISVITLWTGIMLLRKSDEKQNLVIWVFCAAILDMCVQVLCGGIIGKLGLPVSCGSIGIANLAVSIGLGLWIARKGRQEYEIKVLDIISLAVILGITLTFSLVKYGRNLDKLGFISVDASAHCRFAKRVALDHTFSSNLYFTSLTTGMMMQVQLELTGCRAFDLFKAFIFGEIIYTTLAAGLFWALLRQRCGEGKWQRLVPLALTPFYWAGYPVYSTLFGFSYLGVATSLFNLELILTDQFCRKKTYRFVSVIGLNLALYGIFVSYSMFVPTAFFGAFIAIAIQMAKDAGGIRNAIRIKNAGLMLAVFLVPTVLGLMYSFVNLSSATPGGDIANEGGCYNDMYSSFILPLPFVLIGLYCLIKKRDSRFMLPMLAVHLIFMAVLLLGLIKNEVSVYYYVKNNNFLWLMVWTLVAEAIWGMMNRTKLAVLFPLFFYSVLFMGKYVDPWLNNIKGITTRVSVWSYVDLILVNNTYFNHKPEINQGKLELFRFVDENYDPDQVMSANLEIENGWYKTLTGGENTYTYGSYEDFLQEIEELNIRYIVAGYRVGGMRGIYKDIEPYLNTLEVMMENEEGKVFKIPEGSRPTVDAPAKPQEREE